MKTLLLGFGLLLPALGLAQQYTVDWYTIDGGGGTSSNGQYVVSGTIGQPDAGVMSGGSYSLAGGFWSVMAAVQSPGAPLLKIQVLNSTTVKISWPSDSAGWTLQQSPNVNAASWSPCPLSVADDGTNKSVTVNPPTGNWFYRLSHQ